MNSIANYESDLTNWIDSTFESENINWVNTEAEFFSLTNELFKKNKSIEKVLLTIEKKSGKRKKKFDPISRDYPTLNQFSLIADHFFKKIEEKSFELVKLHNQWDNFNSATRLSLFFNEINHWGLNIYTPRIISRRLSELNQFVEDDLLAKKLIIIVLSQKILKQNKYINKATLAKKEYHKVKYYKSEKKEEKIKNQDETTDQENADFVEIEPSFIGGSKGMIEFITNNTSYPERAEEMGKQGIEYVQFIIDKDGNITGDVVIRKGTNVDLAKEAIRVIESMPTWKAGEQNGEKVRVRFTIPIHFRLS